MAYKAKPEVVKAALAIEDEIIELIRNLLQQDHVDVLVDRGSTDPKENGKYGDALVRKIDYEAPRYLIEIKSSSYPGSFSLSDYEKRVSQAHWVIVKGTMGIWAIEMAEARKHLAEKNTGSEKYWVCEPPWETHITVDDIVAHIRRSIG
ncbi:MAG: hypothetical protein JO112_19960 [Planctomycetes bacterium]|nr:hypothetical protein [Planctomycetota bacterium]